MGAAPEAYEAALLQAYPGRGNPLLQALAGKISTRQLRVMLEHLPPGNPAEREVISQWDDATMLIHDAANSLRALTVMTANINREKGTDPIEYTPIPRPEETESQRKALTASGDNRTPEQIQAERDHLRAVLARPNPK